ncbi:restriction endonuclease subunit S [Prevotella intermedia]|uniref:restriction endonuclease subunit S n=1 Tax=Prevotella intermedia TaxID=28131 RepID=UPI0018E0B5D8|nr:restriction endonuclease subunit S [Prevotella intermedia]
MKDIVTFLNGRAYLMPELQEKGKYRILRVGNLSGGNDSWFYSDMELDENKYCKKGDLLYAWACSFGPHIWKEEKVIFHYHIWKLIENKDRVDKIYLYYYLLHQTPFYLGGVNGATMVHITKQNMEKKTVYIPSSLPIQQKIASILSTYDTLIENNNRRIRLLEQMAENLYKEWFVRFRFPGHEKVETENGLPKGWEFKKISNICETIGGGTPSTTNSAYWGGNIKWVTPSDITSKNSLALLKIEGRITEEGLRKSAAKLLPPYTILMTSRASIGFFGLCPDSVCTNQGFISIVPNKANTRMYLLYTLKERKDEIIANANGSTFLEISKGRFRKMKVLIPPEVILDMYEKRSHIIFNEVLNLEKQNTLLTRQRDLLLPRLMSGKLEVKP